MALGATFVERPSASNDYAPVLDYLQTVDLTLLKLGPR